MQNDYDLPIVAFNYSLQDSGSTLKQSKFLFNVTRFGNISKNSISLTLHLRGQQQSISLLVHGAALPTTMELTICDQETSSIELANCPFTCLSIDLFQHAEIRHHILEQIEVEAEVAELIIDIAGIPEINYNNIQSAGFASIGMHKMNHSTRQRFQAIYDTEKPVRWPSPIRLSAGLQVIGSIPYSKSGPAVGIIQSVNQESGHVCIAFDDGKKRFLTYQFVQETFEIKSRAEPR
jgi:hypothetical protein